MVTSRRSALQVVGLTVCGLAGCVSSSTDNDESQSTTSTTPTIDHQIQNLTFDAEILTQQSADTPARFEARLTNTGTESLTIGMGPALMISDTGPDEDPKWTDELVIDPDSDVGPWSEPVQTEDGCWRFPEDGNRSIQSILKYSSSLRQSLLLSSIPYIQLLVYLPASQRADIRIRIWVIYSRMGLVQNLLPVR